MVRINLNAQLEVPRSCVPPPNKHMQRAGTHKVLGRGRSPVLYSHVSRARVLKCQPAGADVGR